jgi:hypothetical protein
MKICGMYETFSPKKPNIILHKAERTFSNLEFIKFRLKLFAIHHQTFYKQSYKKAVIKVFINTVA